MAPSDLVQETFLEAEKRFGQFYGQSEGELIVWLRRVLSTQVARSYRFHSAQKRDFHLEQSLNNEIDASSELLQQVTDPRHSSPSRSAARREEAVLLSNALEQLPEDYRNVILLRNLQGLSFGEVAARMNRTADSVKNLWARALSQLRDTMRRNV
jgi:RNA polymerase sigma-70 factor (ECF subfamily)